MAQMSGGLTGRQQVLVGHIGGGVGGSPVKAMG